MAKSMALGRGLGELLGEVQTAYENSTPSSHAGIEEINVSAIIPNPNQPRKIFDDAKLKELSESIKKHGLLQPVTVVESGNGKFTLVAGERRLRAHKLAGLETIKAIVSNIEEMQLRELALIENIQRDDLNIVELAYSYAQLINEHSLTHEDLSSRVFKSRSTITNTLRLLQLTPYVQQLIAGDKISAGHGKVMLGLEDDVQKKVADSIVGQKLSVRETEQLVKELKRPDEKKTQKAKKKTTKYDFTPIKSVIDLLGALDLKVKAEKNYIKIEINSQDDIDKISNTFSNTL